MTTPYKMPKFFINAFYESKFKDNLFVIKTGGKIVENKERLDNLLSNIRTLNLQGIKVLLIYGHGRLVDEELEARGVPVKKIEGRRITDSPVMDVIQKVVGGTLSLKVTGGMTRNGMDGLSFNAIPPDWMRVELTPKTPEDTLTGGIKHVEIRPILRLFKTTPFIASSCLAITSDGTACNINADTIATQLAIGLKAHKLIFLSDVDGVQINGHVEGLITAEEIAGHMASGAVTGGMKVKLENCKAALEAGVRRIHLISGLREDALKKEIYEPVGPGTMLIHESDRQNYINEIEAQKLIEGQKG